MTIYFNEPKTPGDFSTLSRDWVGASVAIDWQSCFCKKDDKDLQLYGMANTIKGATNFKDKEWKFTPGLLLVSMPLQPFTYKEKTTNVAEITLLMAKFLNDGYLSNDHPFIGTTRLDDCNEQWLSKLLKDDPQNPLDPQKALIYREAFLDGQLNKELANELATKLPATSSGKAGYKSKSLTEKNSELLALLRAQFPGFFTEENTTNLADVYALVAGNPEMLSYIIAIMGMV